MMAYQKADENEGGSELAEAENGVVGEVEEIADGEK
jgi:hypothetical protein